MTCAHPMLQPRTFAPVRKRAAHLASNRPRIECFAAVRIDRSKSYTQATKLMDELDSAAQKLATAKTATREKSNAFRHLDSAEAKSIASGFVWSPEASASDMLALGLKERPQVKS